MIFADFLAIAIIVGILFTAVKIVEVVKTSRTGIKRKDHVKLVKQNAKMKSLLSRVAANDVGNPSLEAQLLLGEFSTEDLKELES